MMLKWTYIQAALDELKAADFWASYPFAEAEEADVEYCVWIRTIEALANEHGFEAVIKHLYHPPRYDELRRLCRAVAHEVIDRYWDTKQSKGGDEQ
jgi:hypothetical protein